MGVSQEGGPWAYEVIMGGSLQYQGPAAAKAHKGTVTCTVTATRRHPKNGARWVSRAISGSMLLEGSPCEGPGEIRLPSNYPKLLRFSMENMLEAGRSSLEMFPRYPDM